MFEVLILQAMHGLSDERCEYLIKDRLSFMRFLGLGLADGVPDANTIWAFREALKKAEAVDALFARFDAALRESGFLAMSGQIVDATIVAAPRQRNTLEEKTAIKDGRIPDAWKDKPAKIARKDRDARWTVKYSKAKPREDGLLPPVDLAVPAFGYKITSRSIAVSGSFANGRRATRRRMTARGSKTCWIEPTQRATSGRTPPIARRRMRPCCRRAASSRASTGRSRRANPTQGTNSVLDKSCGQRHA